MSFSHQVYNITQHLFLYIQFFSAQLQFSVQSQ